MGMESGNGRYQLKKRVAYSRVAAVYLAHDLQTGQDVVIKQFSQLWRDEAFDAAFSQTMTTIASLQHEAIAPIHSFGELNGQLYLAMPYYSGGSLAAKLSSGPLPRAQVTRILTRLCGALDAALAQGVVHHHLSAENVLFDEDDNAYVADFGVMHGEVATFVTDPRYASPEQAMGQPVTARTNIYHVGLLLFQMLTGRVPFEAPTPSAILQLHRYAPIPAAGSANTAVPAAAEAVYRQALAKQPADRFATPAALLAAWQQVEPTVASKAGVAVPTIIRGGTEKTAVLPASTRPKSLMPLLVGLGAIAILAMGGLFWWTNRGGDDSANGGLVNTPPAATQVVFPTATLPSPTATPTAALTATATATPTPTLTATPTPSPTPTVMATATDTRTPLPTATATPSPTVTNTPLPLRQTITLGQPSGTVRNPVAFSWNGLQNATYRVVLIHEGQVFTHTSDWIQGLSWLFSFPAEEFGGWNWYVEDQQGSRSATGFFWFNEFSGGGAGNDGGGGPTAVPTDPPPPP